MKEPGQFAQSEYREAINNIGLSWGLMCDDDKARWARVESAIRADERAKVRAATIEECAKVYRDGAGPDTWDYFGAAERAILAKHKAPA